MEKNKTRHLSKKEVEHIAWLARIELSEEEKELFTEQLNSILDYFNIIDEASTEDIVPTHHVLDLTNVLRDDIVEPSLPRKDFLKNAPDKKDGYFKAPRMM
jgi:aspartyl-tRNA(Asn)/glutamyl-tRNA(Gln) amidotransferase subunit C